MSFKFLEYNSDCFFIGDPLKKKYDFKTYTPEYGKFSKFNAERLKRMGKARINAERELHNLMREISTPQTSMHELYCVISKSIETMGYENLDFNGNLGHSIENHLDDRRLRTNPLY